MLLVRFFVNMYLICFKDTIILYHRPQGLVTIHVSILSMYKHVQNVRICLYIDSIFTWIVTRLCASTAVAHVHDVPHQKV